MGSSLERTGVVSSTVKPRRGEVWWAVLDPVIGHELGGHIEGQPRPVVIVSDDYLNQGALEKVIVVPMSTVARGYASHVAFPLQGGRKPSFLYCEDVRSISTRRLTQRAYPAPIPRPILEEVEKKLRFLLALAG